MSETESKLFDLSIVSAYGRGHWLATELSSRGWKVLLTDVTPFLKPVLSVDAEGPFGLLEGAELLPSQRARLFDEGEMKTSPGGFSMWMKAGPLELKSGLTAHLVKAREISNETESYLRRATTRNKELERERRGVSKLTYARNWLAQFAHVFTSSTHFENHLAVESGHAAPLFSTYSVRALAKEGFERGLKACQTAGVTVRSAKVSGLSLSGSGAVDSFGDTARSFVCAVSFHEMEQLDRDLPLKLFPQGTTDPKWSWERFEFSLGERAEQTLPDATVVIEDADLAWTRANMVVLRREGAKLHAWVKVPVWMRRGTSAFATVAGDVESLLRRRIPQAELTFVKREPIASIPWPIYSEEPGDRERPLKSSNLFFTTPEVWPELDWLGRFRFENEIVTRLDKLKVQWDAALRKEAARRAKQ